MRTRTGSVSAHHVRAVVLGAERRGVDTGPLLARAGLPPELLAGLPSELPSLSSDLLAGLPTDRVPSARFGRLVRLLWASLDDELLGFGGAPTKVGSFAMMGHLVVHGSRDLREA
ncbi:AraC family transcriptional regulator ligand-binding domain-containing protein, partial [Streptomyces anthocyanicus]|uniref:AraC family transcriptional regulator ligand-binding domain-containing protein n=1 Tax=Streptomyces anthocyanicus TaxID=68174 RepID=UPI00366A006D